VRVGSIEPRGDRDDEVPLAPASAASDAVTEAWQLEIAVVPAQLRGEAVKVEYAGL
jgi:hypothetical protein